MEIIDFNCFAGSWPFYKLRIKSFKDLEELHEKNIIKGGFVSSLNGIFYNDPYEADFELKEQIDSSNYRQFITVNPMLIGCLNDVRRSIIDINPAGVRICPGYHGYLLSDAKVSELCNLLRELNLPLIITMRVEDARLTYLLHCRLISTEELSSFLKSQAELKILITGADTGEILGVKDIVLSKEKTFFDTSGINRTPFPMEHIISEGFANHLIYGSNAPLSCLGSSLSIVKNENISETYRNLILSGERFLEGIF